MTFTCGKVTAFVINLSGVHQSNAVATTITGNMHGMSAAFLCGEGGLDGLLGNEPRAPIDSWARRVMATLASRPVISCMARA